MVKRTFKLLISSALWIVDRVSDAARRLAGRQNPVRGIVLYYHAVKPGLRDGFASQMDTLCRHATPWRIDGDLPGKPGHYVAVSFDDGYQSVVDQALPELKKRNIPFTMFFPTGSWNSRPSWVTSPEHPFFCERVLSREELVQLAGEPLLTIGSHSVTHPNFCKLSETAAAGEFRESKQELEQLLGRPVTLFSFPHGACNRRLVRQALEAGYRRIFTIEPERLELSSSPATFGRVAVEPDDWPMEFRLKLAGAYRWNARGV